MYFLAYAFVLHFHTAIRRVNERTKRPRTGLSLAGPEICGNFMIAANLGGHRELDSSIGLAQQFISKCH